MENLPDVTALQVRTAVINAQIDYIPHHSCGICGVAVFYSVDLNTQQLFFNPGCGCSWSPREPLSWEEAADWINMQRSPEWKAKLYNAFGLSV